MARRNPLIAALLLAVVLGHALVLQWLAWQAQDAPGLRLMDAPMFTRLLQQRAPPPAPAAPARVDRVARATTVLEAVAAATPAAAAPPEPDPEIVASAPPAATPAAIVTPAPEVGSPTDTAASGSATTADTATATQDSNALDSWPADTRVSFQVGGYFRGELHGNALVEWQRDGDRYQTRIDIDLGLVSLVMLSQGRVGAQGLVPIAYEETRAGKRRSALLQDKIVLSDGSQVPRPDGVQDTASQFVELSHRFASGQLPLEVGRSVSFWMARPGGVDFWTYDVTDKEVLQTPQLGPVEAFHLKPRPLADARGNITAEMWFAPSLQYLPVRIRVSTGEAHVDLLVEKIEQR